MTATRKAPRHRKLARGGRTILVTGFPGFIGRRLLQKLLHEEPDSAFFLLVQPKFAEDARRAVRSARRQNLDRVQLLLGDIADMHLGLSAAEVQRLTRQVTDIYHLAAISYLGVSESEMTRVNVGGTNNLLELAEAARRLRRFNHISTCFVSGDRQGVIAEDELACDQSFRNAYERTKFEAERLVRDKLDRLPISIYRPSIVVGDSKTGEIGRFDGPYTLVIWLVSSPLAVPLPLPGEGNMPLNVVPVDYVVDAIRYLSQQPAAVGLCFQLVDPNPLSVRRVYRLIAERTGVRPDRLRPSGGLGTTLLQGLSRAARHLPGLDRISRAPLQALDAVSTMAIYSSANTTRLLYGAGIQCPPFEHYVDNLIGYVRHTFEQQRAQRDRAEDPLA